jgi:replicative DNA helicase
MPSNRDAEMGLLGSILINPNSIAEIRPLVEAEDFFLAQHQWIYQAMLALDDKGQHVDLVLMDAALAGKDYGGVAYLTQLLTSTPMSLAAPGYARLIHDLAVRRKLIMQAQMQARLAFNTEMELEEVVTQSMDEFDRATASRSGEGPQDAHEVMSMHYDQVTQAQAGSIKSIPTGLLDWDKYLAGGFKPQTINIVGGRTGIGKTVVATTVLKNTALAGYTPLFFSLEQPAAQIANRLVAKDVGASVEMFDQKDGLTQGELQKWNDTVGKMERLKFFIDDTPGRDINYILSQARRLKKQHSIGLVIIDYIQLIQPARKNAKNSLEEITDVLKHLHNGLRILDLPCLATAQLSRELDKRQDKHPLMADLYGSSQWEHYSYSITFLHRDDFYDAASLNKGMAELIVAKHRQGPTGTATVVFLGKYARLENAVIQTVNLNAQGVTI